MPGHASNWLHLFVLSTTTGPLCYANCMPMPLTISYKNWQPNVLSDKPVSKMSPAELTNCFIEDIDEIKIAYDTVQ